MEVQLLSTLLGVLMVPHGQVVSTSEDLDLQKIAGFWREVGVASDYNLSLKDRRVEALFLTQSGRNLTVKAVFNNSGTCETEKAEGVDAAGKFYFPGHREIRVLETDYEHYAILRLSLVWQGRDFHVFKYLTRSLEEENAPSFWRFRELTADMGLYLVSRQGRCAKLLKERSASSRHSAAPEAQAQGREPGSLDTGPGLWP